MLPSRFLMQSSTKEKEKNNIQSKKIEEIENKNKLMYEELYSFRDKNSNDIKEFNLKINELVDKITMNEAIINDFKAKQEELEKLISNSATLQTQEQIIMQEPPKEAPSEQRSKSKQRKNFQKLDTNMINEVYTKYPSLPSGLTDFYTIGS